MAHLSKLSPSGNKSIELTFDREIHFGPFLFTIATRGFEINRKIGTITDNVLWSGNEKYLVVVEVGFDSVKNKNFSDLLVINTTDGSVSQVIKKYGEIKPTSISDTGDVTY